MRDSEPLPVVTITLVPHTHWDREWYEPFSVFSERLVDMMDTLLDLADNDFPHFHLDGQTAMIDDYLAIRPEREADIRGLVAEGRLSAGPWFTQMDEFLTSGESHIRNLERGLARAIELGLELDVGYLPDQFGHIGQMPQILRHAGLERAVVWRGVPLSIERDAFRWEAPDGSSVLTEYLAFGYFNGGAFSGAGDPEELAEAIARCVERQRPFMASDRILVMVGSDHTGPDAALPDRLEAARSSLDGIEAEIGGLGDHLASQRLNGEPPAWQGELRSSARAHMLPNVYSARVRQKRERGRVEALLERYAEPLAALVPGFDWPAEELERPWTLLLWNGAHDSACGCSHDQVALDVDARFAEARTICEDVATRALESLGSQVEAAGVIRFNPSPFEREGVPALGWRVASSAAEVVTVPVSIAVKRRALAADDIRFRLLDEPDAGDLYNFCPDRERQVPSRPDRVEVDGDEIVATWDGLTVRMRVTRRQDEPFLRLDGVIRNDRPDHRLRLSVDLPKASGEVFAGSPFELVRRLLVSEGGELEAASPTWPARGVVMTGGAAVLHEGVFEYEVVEERAIVVTLLRCVGNISRRELATRPFPAGPDVPTPLGQMLGETEFSLGVWQWPDLNDLLREWERFALPLLEAEASGGGSLPSTGTLMELRGGGQLSSVRGVEGRVQVRLWNDRFDTIEADVSGEHVTLGPARIETFEVER
ncbi:MAG: hypothetical protein M3O88_03180 [Actinomycetota bacterium]|nr:hypothetical protein [Actinomycetota bacterium]